MALHSIISALRQTYLIFNLIIRHFRFNSQCPPLPLDPRFLKSFRNININEISSFRIKFFPMSPNSSISPFFILLARCREEGMIVFGFVSCPLTWWELIISWVRVVCGWFGGYEICYCRCGGYWYACWYLCLRGRCGWLVSYLSARSETRDEEVNT